MHISSASSNKTKPTDIDNKQLVAAKWHPSDHMVVAIPNCKLPTYMDLQIKKKKKTHHIFTSLHENLMHILTVHCEGQFFWKIMLPLIFL